MKDSNRIKEKSSEKEFSEYQDSNVRFLILYNDNINSFDFVVKSLIEICSHNDIQAEQCTMLAHFNGKCDVKKGSFTALKPMKDLLIDRGLKATID
ncbi:MAG: ATP-dependent Clp protease adaptor ClpS [Bacteroidales bacterium]|nr:ATP-dependent Clp protease adaptor ClpS [Bacteroidales bacterium]MCF8457905.1 ATP-dependent Clp protease adaptor ClpS [Bacteroidales bacterium]